MGARWRARPRAALAPGLHDGAIRALRVVVVVVVVGERAALRGRPPPPTIPSRFYTNLWQI
jgi:hypothetical protein